jgi:hypothetical protein
LPQWLGKFGSDLLGAGESWIKKIGWIILWIVLGIVGVVILGGYFSRNHTVCVETLY